MTSKHFITRNGEPVFIEGTEEIAIGLIISGAIQCFIFLILSLVLDYALANRSPNIWYSTGRPFSVCDPDVVLYYAFMVGLIALILSAVLAVKNFYKNKKRTSVTKYYIGAAVASIGMLLFPTTLIIGMHGRLFLVPICR